MSRRARCSARTALIPPGSLTTRTSRSPVTVPTPRDVDASVESTFARWDRVRRPWWADGHPDRRNVRYVAMFDILGFKALVRAKRLDEVVALLQRTRVAAAAHAGEFSGESSSYYGGEGETLVHTRLLSDTIVMWTNDSRKRCFRGIVWASGRLMAESFLSGIPLRGAISAGPLYVGDDGELLVGEALVTAHELESDQAWAGAAVDDHAEMESDDEMPNSLDRGLVWYPPPSKKALEHSPICVDWPLHLKPTVPWSRIASIWPPCLEPEDKQKKQNTRKFFEHCRSRSMSFGSIDMPGLQAVG